MAASKGISVMVLDRLDPANSWKNSNSHSRYPGTLTSVLHLMRSHGPFRDVLESTIKYWSFCLECSDRPQNLNSLLRDVVSFHQGRTRIQCCVGFECRVLPGESEWVAEWCGKITRFVSHLIIFRNLNLILLLALSSRL